MAIGQQPNPPMDRTILVAGSAGFIGSHIDHNQAGISKARTMLGHEPTLTLEDGLETLTEARSDHGTRTDNGLSRKLIGT
ncbi:hypothetical protein [Halostagnicola bangensis]